MWRLLELLEKIDECSLARAREFFATGRALGLSLKYAQFRMTKPGNIREACARYECSWKHAFSFC